MNVDEKELDEMLAVQINHLNIRGKIFLSDLIFEIVSKDLIEYIKQEEKLIHIS